ncbi:MAG: hypothetical protein ABR986_02055 [Methanomassiliicoccales archaeon]|jgi:hypothetical protein
MNGDTAVEILMSDEKRRDRRRNPAMKDVISLMIAHEDRHGKAMTLEELAGVLHFPDLDLEVLLFEMLGRSYVSCLLDQEQAAIDIETAVTTTCHAWGTTFFGRDWYRSEERKIREVSVHFYFPDRAK